MTSVQRMQFFWQRTRRSAVFYGIFATGIRVGANILLLPLLLTKLPTADLAVWWVFCALGNFANLADFGFGQVISRVTAFSGPVRRISTQKVCVRLLKVG